MNIQVDFESVVNSNTEETNTMVQESAEFFLTESEISRIRGAITSAAVASGVTV